MPPIAVESLAPHLRHLADELLASADAGRTIDPASRVVDLDLPRADAIGRRIAMLRVARGERPIGYKIGFTNRTIWSRYGVHHPIWAPVYDTSVECLDGRHARVAAARFAQPRLEPEIVVCVDSPPASASLADLVRALRWIAHGFEIVASVYPEWRFTGAESHAAQGLHAALFVGRPVEPAAFGDDPAGALSALEVELRCAPAAAPAAEHGTLVERGRGANVLDGPLQALAHLVSALRAGGHDLAPGDIVTTGTLTDAQPIAPGQRWSTRLAGTPLAGLVLGVE